MSPGLRSHARSAFEPDVSGTDAPRHPLVPEARVVWTSVHTAIRLPIVWAEAHTTKPHNLGACRATSWPATGAHDWTARPGTCPRNRSSPGAGATDSSVQAAAGRRTYRARRRTP